MHDRFPPCPVYHHTITSTGQKYLRLRDSPGGSCDELTNHRKPANARSIPTMSKFFRVFRFTFNLLLWNGKNVKHNKLSVQDLIPPHSINVHMFTWYTYTNTYMPRFSPSGVFGSSWCLVPTPGFTSSTLWAVCKCVCIYANIHPQTLSLSHLER